MGTWGTGIFEDDLASDIKGNFEDLISSGASVADATKSSLAEYSDSLTDTDDGPTVHLALAKLQIQQGALHPDTAKKALEIIESGESLNRWREIGGEDLKHRQAELEKLKEEIAAKT
ncbi:MAG: DUF4259 domain-containing protein [Patescibacteria group bacterium]